MALMVGGAGKTSLVLPPVINLFVKTYCVNLFIVSVLACAEKCHLIFIYFKDDMQVANLSICKVQFRTIFYSY